MIDFKKALTRMGVRATLRQQLPTLPALVSDYGSEDCSKQINVEFELVEGEDRRSWSLRIHGGPTGYESCDLVKILENQEVGAKWVACMGSHRYPRMEIRIDNIRHAVANYNVNYSFEAF